VRHAVRLQMPEYCWISEHAPMFHCAATFNGNDDHLHILENGGDSSVVVKLQTEEADGHESNPPRGPRTNRFGHGIGESEKCADSEEESCETVGEHTHGGSGQNMSVGRRRAFVRTAVRMMH
jgi:hypothetical protein